MAKWIIPRHKPRSAKALGLLERGAGTKENRNNRKAKKEKLIQEKMKRTRAMSRFIRLEDKVGHDTRLLRFATGSCIKKVSYPTLDSAKSAAVRLTFRYRHDNFVYRCPLCFGFHLTSTRLEGYDYEYEVKIKDLIKE